MNTRSIAFLLTAVGICFAASQLTANEPAQPDDITQDVGEPLASDQCGVERTDLEAWMTCEECMFYDDTYAVDEASEPIVANENLTPEIAEGLVGQRDGMVYADEAFESEGITVAEETVADELFESEAVVGEETVQVDADDDVRIFEEAAAKDAETTEEEIFANEELTGGSIWIEVFDACFDEAEFAADESIQEEITIEETVEAIESAEVEGNVEGLETAIEEATAVEEFVETAEVLEAENAVDVVEPTIEEVTIVEETADGVSSVAVETIEEESFEQEAIEDAQDVIVEPSTANEDIIEEQVSEDVDIDANEDVTTGGVVEFDETLEVVEPLIEEAELPEPEGESTAGDEVNESETGTVRTIELGGCKVTIQSDRQMDEFELLNMLWEAVEQLEAEMD